MKRVNTDIAYDYLREEILNGTLLPGEPLMTEEISSRIGVSRTPVRDALRRLESDGLVSIIPRAGAHVTRLDDSEFIELCEARLALESFAAGAAAENRTRVELLSIRRAFDQLARFTKEFIHGGQENKTLEQLYRADVGFHLAVIEASRNRLILREVQRLNLVRRVALGSKNGFVFVYNSDDEREGATERLRQIHSFHENIFHAIESKDAAGARAAMEEHIQDVIFREGLSFAHPKNGAFVD